MTEDYYRSFLVRTIAAAGQDHAQLRMLIYQFARSELRRELFQRKDFCWAEMKEQTSALEKVIEQIESDFAEHDMLLPDFSSPAPANRAAITRSPNTALVVRENVSALEKVIEPIDLDARDGPIGHHAPVTSVHYGPPPTVHHEPAPAQIRTDFRPKPIRSAFWSTVQLVVAVVLGVGLFSAVENRGGLFNLLRHGRGAAAEAAAVAEGPSGHGAVAAAMPNMTIGDTLSSAASDPALRGVPLPGAYGVYAIAHGKLTDLDSLPIRVPDQRVGVSAVFSTPSTVTFPDGRLEFLVFRRDLVNNAPDKAMVRVVARVKRALTFDPAGRPRIINVDASWAVRGTAYEMKVAPLNGHPEMILIRPASADFSFSAGRYALVLQGVGYDFSIAGPVTDLAQCLERTDAVDMPVYSECRGP